VQARAAGGSDASAPSNNNATMQLQLDEKSKVVELQKTEIMRLRAQLMDAELRPSSVVAGVTSRPSSAARLPPMHAVGAQ